MTKNELRIIDEEDFQKLEMIQREIVGLPIVTEEDLPTLLQTMGSPVELQKELIVKVKKFLDYRINAELAKIGTLGDNTRKWVATYNEMLNGLQKNTFGEKSMNIHVHNITHNQVSTIVRQHQRVSVDDAILVMSHESEKATTTE